MKKVHLFKVILQKVTQVAMALHKPIQIHEYFSVIIQGHTPLLLAAIHGQEPCCSILLAAGSNVDCSFQGVTLDCTDQEVMVKKYLFCWTKCCFLGKS